MQTLEYSTGTIEFTPNDRRGEKRKYSDRSLVELRVNDQNDFSLRALDIPNKKQVIFDFNLTKPDMYKRGQSSDMPDQFHVPDGVYSLNLRPETRNKFHAALQLCLTQLASNSQPSSTDANRGKSSENKSSARSVDTRTDVGASKILSEIHQLNQNIQQGNVDKIETMIRQLLAKGVRLRLDNAMEPSDNEKLRINIKIDGIDSETRNLGQTAAMEVYPSTTVHELRALFTYTHKFPVENQYFFVNGHLAHEQSTMNDLKVQNGTLFVLLVTKPS